MPRRYPQGSIMMYPKTEKLLEEAMKVTGKHKAAALREAVDIGLQQLISQHQPTPANPCPLEATKLQEKINQIWEKVMGDDR